MRGTKPFHTLFWGKLSFFLVISFLMPGCHTGNEPVPVPQVTVKKEETFQNSGGQPCNITEARQITGVKANTEKQKIPGTSVKTDAAGYLLPEKQNDKFKSNEIDGSSPNTKQIAEVSRSDPFALPKVLQKQQPISSVQQNLKVPSQNTFMHQPAPLNSPEPSVYGIFGNGAEYFALIRWQQIQGVFGSGEHLGNGYYVKEITASSVLLCPDRNRCSTNSITLTFH